MKLTKEQLVKALRELPQEKPPFQLVDSVMKKIHELKSHQRKPLEETAEKITVRT
jgi:hypothetical protein